MTIYILLDRMSIGKEIQKRATHVIDCFIQVNVSGEASKSGVTPEELEALLKMWLLMIKFELSV